MQKLVIKKIKFSSLLKVVLLITFTIGFVLGLLILILSPISESSFLIRIEKNIFGSYIEKTFQGPIVNLFFLIYLSVASLIYGFVIGIILYFVFNLILRLFKIITLKGEFELYEHEEKIDKRDN